MNPIKVLTLFIFLTFGFTTYAQLSIQVGLNASSREVSVEGLSLETDTKVGFHVGINYMTPVSNVFYFRPGAHYSQKGAKFFEFEESQDYLEIPLVLVYQKNIEEGFYAEGGPYLGILLSAKDYDDSDIKDSFSTVDLGLMLGAGYDFGKMILGARGSLGLTDLAKDDGTANEGKIVNSNGQLYIAVKL